MDSMQYRPLNANQEVSNPNHFGSISDILSRLAAASECMASMINNDIAKGRAMILPKAVLLLTNIDETY